MERVLELVSFAAKAERALTAPFSFIFPSARADAARTSGAWEFMPPTSAATARARQSATTFGSGFCIAPPCLMLRKNGSRLASHQWIQLQRGG